MTATRILLVEDDPVSREVIAALLASRGHDVETVGDGFNALRLAQEQSFDLALVDYHLPEMDGYTLARLMRSLSEGSDGKLKMVAITADQSGLARRQDVASIFDHVLAKPIDPDTLFTSIDAFLGRGSTLGALEAFAADNGNATQAGAGQSLWRVRGLGARPKAQVFPFPTAAERRNLEHCFQITDRDADCIILLRPAGLAALEAVRAGGRPSFQPLFVLDPSLATSADVCFQVGDADSWTAAAKAIIGFAARHEHLNPDVADASDFDMRLAAYVFVADRPLVLARDAKGDTIVPYTGGFSAAAIAGAVKRLGTRGLVTARVMPAAAGADRNLVIDLSAKGVGIVAKSAPPQGIAVRDPDGGATDSFQAAANAA